MYVMRAMKVLTASAVTNIRFAVLRSSSAERCGAVQVARI